MHEGQLEDQTSGTTTYVGSQPCLVCHELLTPLEVAYNGDLCTIDKRAAQARLVQNKRVGALA